MNNHVTFNDIMVVEMITRQWWQEWWWDGEVSVAGYGDGYLPPESVLSDFYCRGTLLELDNSKQNWNFRPKGEGRSGP